MPMGQSAARLSTPPMPPLPMPPKGNAPMPLPMPPISNTPAVSVGAPSAMPPAPGATAMPQTGTPQPQTPYTVRMQPDGSSLYTIPSPDGNAAQDIVLGLNPPPKMPKAFQKASGAQQ